jgi:hypothetical protein
MGDVEKGMFCMFREILNMVGFFCYYKKFKISTNVLLREIICKTKRHPRMGVF